MSNPIIRIVADFQRRHPEVSCRIEFEDLADGVVQVTFRVEQPSISTRAMSIFLPADDCSAELEAGAQRLAGMLELATAKKRMTCKRCGSRSAAIDQAPDGRPQYTCQHKWTEGKE